MSTTLYLKHTGSKVSGKEVSLSIREYYYDVDWTVIAYIGWDEAAQIERTKQVSWWFSEGLDKASVCKYCDQLRTHPCQTAEDIKKHGKNEKTSCNQVLNKFGDLMENKNE